MSTCGACLLVLPRGLLLLRSTPQGRLAIGGCPEPNKTQTLNCSQFIFAAPFEIGLRRIRLNTTCLHVIGRGLILEANSPTMPAVLHCGATWCHALLFGAKHAPSSVRLNQLNEPEGLPNLSTQ